MITATGIELRAGAELLLQPTACRVNAGDRIGLVGRNGAGKTTLMQALAGESRAAAGTVHQTGSVGYLPQETAPGDPETTVVDRILSSRGLDRLGVKMERAQELMTHTDPDQMNRGIKQYAKLEARFEALGGYGAKAEAARIAANLGLEDRVLQQVLGTLSGGQRRRVELARILFQEADTLLLDEPTNHLDQDSVLWLRDFLRSYSGGFMVISHDVTLLADTVTKVFHLDARRHQLDQYNLGWADYLLQREQDERRRRRERAGAEKKAAVLLAQADKMRAKATKAVAAQNMAKRAQRMLDQTQVEASAEKVAAIRFPDPAPVGKTPLSAQGLSKSYGSLEVFTDVDLAIDRGSRVVILGLNGAGKTTLLRILAGVEAPDTGSVLPGHGLKLGYYAQEHELLDLDRTVLENMASAAPDLETTEVRKILGSFLFSGDAVFKPARVLSGGEKTRLALAILVVSAANVLLLDEPTNNLDPASRDEILGALTRVKAAVVLVTHDAGAVRALNPERVLLLPDGDEDLWSSDYEDLIELA
ncbi:MAG: ATP-binding cassette domain-containing protein [Bifidobacteriaceae bacterium]|nr:ATP-binding cassette domain-containing protein [Bifidobacteriaceae bacterium]